VCLYSAEICTKKKIGFQAYGCENSDQIPSFGGKTPCEFHNIVKEALVNHIPSYSNCLKVGECH
jgi:hypothetical protein